MTEYRRRQKSKVWHFHRDCRWWPQARADHVTLQIINGVVVLNIEKRPKSGELCNECLAKAKRDK
jgi:hypothetical protein